MARFGDRIATTEALIREYADGLRAIAAQFDQQADMLKTLGIERVEATNWASAKDGADKIASFAGALQKAIINEKLMGGLDRVKGHTAAEITEIAKEELSTRRKAKKKHS